MLDGGRPTTVPLIVTEVSARGTDWIELQNGGLSPLALEGLHLTDVDESGVPDNAHLTPLPALLTLAAGERLIALCKPDPMLEGLVSGSACLLEGVGALRTRQLQG